MITPAEIESKVFKKTMRGYHPDEVDEFLDDIIIDMQGMIAENNMLKQRILNMEKEIESIKSQESEAKKIMNDISESAEKRADAIVKNAYMDAESIKRNAKENSASLEDENRKMQIKVNNFKENYKKLLESEIESMDRKFDELFGDAEIPVLEETEEKVTDRTIVMKKEPEPEKVTKDTLVVDSRDFEEMLMEDYSNIGDSVKFNGDDKNTIII